MALGAMTVVAVSILTAITLLPALIAMLGDRVLPGGIVARVLSFFKHRVVPPARAAGGRRRPAFWERWTPRVMARPWTAVIGVSGGPAVPRDPGALADTGTQALSQFPKDSDVRVGNELASKQLGGGTDPVQIVAAFDGGRARSRRGRRLHPHGRGDARRQLRRPARLRRRQRPDPGDAERAERVRRGGRPGRPPARHGRARDARWPASPASTSAAKPPAATTSAARSAARCGRSSSSSSRSASSS